MKPLFPCGPMDKVISKFTAMITLDQLLLKSYTFTHFTYKHTQEKMIFCDLQCMLWNEPNLWQNWLQSNIWKTSKVSWLWLTHNVTHRSWLTSHWHDMLIFCQTGPFPHLNSKCTGMEAHRSMIRFTAAIMSIDSCGMALCSPAMR